ARCDSLLTLRCCLLAVRARCDAHPQPLSLENPDPRDVADPTLRNRRADDRHVEAHIFAWDLVDLDDLKGPAAPDKCGGTVIAANAGGLNLRRCNLPRRFGAFFVGMAQRPGRFAPLLETLRGSGEPFRPGAVRFTIGQRRLNVFGPSGFLMTLP